MAPPHLQLLKSTYPWIITPLVVGAPMKLITGPAIAAAISCAGGIGFIGPLGDPRKLGDALYSAKQILDKSASSSSASSSLRLQHSSHILPVGVGFQTWDGDLSAAAEAIGVHCPAAAWLFAPRHGQSELDSWAQRIREVSPNTQIWMQIGSVEDALKAAQSDQAPDVLVVQGQDAGGHGLSRGAGIVTLLPEVADALEVSEKGASIPLIAAGGIVDGRGMTAALALGASGIAMGTRFLASEEAQITRGYQDTVIKGSDGGQKTVKTQLYNHLRGTMNWPAGYEARGLLNRSWVDHENGMSFEENRMLYGEAIKKGDEGWGEEGRLATYAGTAVGLIKEVKGAGEIVRTTRTQTERVTSLISKM
ncbi:hypothetical protein MMC14_005843 [Varicellaria rhodocarpa]|nr:hypothetical protein [Varicellaria rhodocarpa]